MGENKIKNLFSITLRQWREKDIVWFNKNRLRLELKIFRLDALYYILFDVLDNLQNALQSEVENANVVMLDDDKEVGFSLELPDVSEEEKDRILERLIKKTNSQMIKVKKLDKIEGFLNELGIKKEKGKVVEFRRKE